MPAALRPPDFESRRRRSETVTQARRRNHRIVLAGHDQRRHPQAAEMRRHAGARVVIGRSGKDVSPDDIIVSHWLVVTIFALFYGVLKWVYRKRGKAVADD